MMKLYTHLVVSKNNQRSLILILFMAISQFGFSQNKEAFKQRINNISDPLLKVELILSYTDSLLWDGSYEEEIPIYLDEVVEICKTSDCGEMLIHAQVSKIDFTLLGESKMEGVLPQLEDLLANPITQSPNIRAYIHQIMGDFYLLSEHSETEFNHFLKGVHILESEAPFDKRLGLLYHNTAILYNYKSLPDSCIYFGEKARDNFENNRDTLKLILTCLTFNNWYQTVGDSEAGFKSLFRAKKLSEEHGGRDKNYYDIIIGMGLSYEKRKEGVKAIDIAEKAIERILKGTTLSDHDKSLKLWNLYLIKGRGLMRAQRAEEGLVFINKSIKVCKENNLFPSMILISELFVIEAQIKLENFEIAHSILNDFLNNTETNPSYEIYNIKLISLMTELYKSSGIRPNKRELPILKKIIKRVIEKNEGKFNSSLLKAYKLAALLQLNENRKIEAIVSYDKISEIKDSIWSHKKTKTVDRLLIAHQSKEQEQEIALQQERLDEAGVHQKLLISLLTVLSLLVGLAVLFFWQRKQYVSNLEYKVHERTAELEATNKKLVESNEELERFAYITSHDLKEPLRNIISFIGLLDKRDLGTDVNTKSYFRFIKENSIHMSQLIEGVLAFSLLKKTVIVKKTVNVQQIITKVQNAISQMISEKNIQFKISNLPIVKTDDSMLYMVFKNLIENAIKYNENEMPVIEIDYTEDEQFYWFSVSDNGIGIEEEYFNQIFEMFKRLHNKSQYMGTGIGLAICKRTVKYLGGEITITSKLGEGSVFSFSIKK